MAYFSNHINSPAFPVKDARNVVTGRIAGVISRLKARRPVKTDIPFLAEYSDAELADIGLLRADLIDDMHADRIDAQAQSMLRVYR